MTKELIWPLVGIIFISVAVSFSFIYESLWLGFFIALGAGLVLLLIMTWNMLSGVQSAGIKKTVGVLFFVLSALVIYNSVFEWNKSKQKNEILIEIRQTIDGGIAQMEAEEVLIESLRYKFLNDDVDNLAEAFRAVSGDRLKEDGTLLTKPEKQGQYLNFSANIVHPDSVVITVVADIAEGMEKDFSNSNGRQGKYQGMATLTPNGVRYVRQN